ncbi:MAG: CSLREA domain-containing protein [Anaerolineaceae bacterium]|nr:CSLREA domain-containing protein [Anaerolineaceae bacterium]
MFTVNTADDEDNGYCSWRHCSLREAIQAANALNGGHHDDDDDDDDDDGAYSQYRYGGNSYYADEIIIKFDIDGLDPIVIAPTSALPAITTSLELKGDTASIVLDGSEAGQADGLLLAADDILVRGLTIRNFAGNGLVINGSNNRVEDSVMSENGGSGIVVLDGSGNLFNQNALFGNAVLGVDLSGDGPTANDLADGDEGANGRQNTATLIRAVPMGQGLVVEGILNSQPTSAYVIDLYANESCAAGQGQGATWLGSTQLMTDEAGNGSFETAVPTELTTVSLTALVTGADGTSEFSRCIQSSLGNDAWPRAQRLGLTPDSVSNVQTAEISQAIDQLGQSRWFKFTVQPNSQLVITLTDLPANYDLTVYKDIAAEWQSLLTLDETEDLVSLTAEFAPDAFSPDAFSPDAFSPDAFSPDAFSPDAFSPDAFSPDAFSPDAFSPDAFSPDAFSPDAFSPDAFSPDAFSPDAFSPDAFSPDAFSPDASPQTPSPAPRCAA